MYMRGRFSHAQTHILRGEFHRMLSSNSISCNFSKPLPFCLAPQIPRSNALKYIEARCCGGPRPRIRLPITTVQE
jgi:hypothetical protein